MRRRRLGAELRRLREEAALTIEQVAEKLECSASTVSRIETGHVQPRTRDVRYMLDIYGVTERRRDGLIRLAREAGQRGWWQPYVDLQVATLVDLEDAASSMRCYLTLLVPGLLQTEAYARAVLQAVNPDLAERSSEIDRRVELRMKRQSRLTGDRPLELWVVLDEAALRRAVGGRQVMRQQLRRLLEASAFPHVSLQVLPFEVGAHAGVDSDFTIVSFPAPHDLDAVVYLEHSTSDLFLEDVAAVRRYSLLFDAVSDRALSQERTTEMLAQVAKDL